MKNPELVILAAGMGSRYGGLKQIDKIDDYGHIIIDYSIYDAIKAGFRNITFIIKKEIEKDFREVMDAHLAGKNVNVKYVYQELYKLPEGYEIPEGRIKPWGTAHAIACCKGIVEGPFAVINADDYYGAHAFEKIYQFLKNTNDEGKSHYAMVGYRIKNTVTEQGTVSRGVCTYDADTNMLTSVVERTKIGTENGKIYFLEGDDKFDLDPDTLVSMNLWGFTPSYIDECCERLAAFLDENVPKNPMKCEYLLPTLVATLIDEGKADVKVIENEDKWFGVTYKEDKETVVEAFRNLIANGTYPKGF
ncbi:MAG: nucleotidyltransferase [Clostridia bacterium]|nr:nucleotidyltransferase [Clostridia bacterium]